MQRLRKHRRCNKRKPRACDRRVWVPLCALFLLACVFAGVARRVQAPEPAAASPAVRLYLAAEERVAPMALEDYLIGVVAAEMPASFAPEACKAQAVAARTYALRRLDDPCGEAWDVCSRSNCCQAYKSDEALRAVWGTAYAKNRAKIARAVAETRGEAACYDGALIEALYHSSAGGRTEDAQHVFAAQKPYLVSVESPGEEASSQYAAQKRFTRKAFVRAVNKGVRGANLKTGALETQVEVLSRYASGRVERLRLGEATVSGREFRKLLDLNSANFTVAVKKDAVEIATLGYGHGVGMSQYGANAMAKQGATYKEILTHFYVGISIEKQY